VRASQAKTPNGFGVWPETAIRLTHRNPSVTWKPRWLLWLEARQRTSFAVQQQRFDTDKQC